MKLVGVGGLVIASSLAHADALSPSTPIPEPTPDPAAMRASEANLESIAWRSGTMFSAAFGGSLTLGDSVGSGGAVSLRIGRVANPDLLVTLELVTSVSLVQIGDATLTNQASSFLVGLQYYVNSSLWVRGGAGLGGYRPGKPPSDTHIGLSSGVGAGIDIARWRHVILDVELVTASLVHRHGILATGALCLGLSFN